LELGSGNFVSLVTWSGMLAMSWTASKAMWWCYGLTQLVVKHHTVICSPLCPFQWERKKNTIKTSNKVELMGSVKNYLLSQKGKRKTR